MQTSHLTLLRREYASSSQTLTAKSLKALQIKISRPSASEIHCLISSYFLDR